MNSIIISSGTVTLDEDCYKIQGQSIRDIRVNRQRLEAGFEGLVIAENLFDQLGPAVVSGKPIFIYGPPGNGKTAISVRLGSVMDDIIMIPYAIYVEGNVIRVYDEVTHRPVTGEAESLPKADARWTRCHRPVVLVGGEMTLEMLDLAFNPILKYYEAPFAKKLKANNGLFIVDDFGRQRIAPQELLNRWIIPMENRRDYLACTQDRNSLSLSTSCSSFQLTWNQNLWWTRLSCAGCAIKSNWITLTRNSFRLFSRLSVRITIEYSEEIVNYLLEQYYNPTDRPMDACQSPGSGGAGDRYFPFF